MFSGVTEAGKIALWILAILFPLQLFVGFLMTKKGGQSASHYFISGKQLPLWLVFFAEFATVCGVSSFLGYSGKAYQIGLGQSWMLLGEQGSKFFFAILIAGVAGRYAYNTLSEFMEQEMFHDKLLRAVSGFALSLPMIAWTGAQAIGIGSLLAVVMGIDPATGIWGAALVAILYTVMGGSWAIVWTDVIQGSIRIFVALFFYGTLYYATGGVEGLQLKLAAVKPEMLTFGAAGYLASLALVLTPTTGIFTYQAYWQRCFSSKNSKVAQRGYLITSCFALVMYGLSMYAGMVAYSLNPDLARPDMAFPWLLNSYVNPVLAALMVVTIIGADMTVSAGLLNSGVTLWTCDIIKPYFRPNATDKELVQIARWMTLVIGVGVVWVAFSFPTIISAGLWGWQMCGGGLFIPMMLGMYWKNADGKTKVTKNAALASLLIAGTLAAWIQFDPDLLKMFGGGITPGLCLSLVLTVGISLYERRKIRNSNVELGTVENIAK